MEPPRAPRLYRLPPDRLSTAERRIRNQSLIPQLGILAALILVSTFLGFHHNPSQSFPTFLVIFPAAFLTYIFFVAPRSLHKKLTKLWNTYSLEIGSDYLLRQQGDTPDIRLPFSEIKHIERQPGKYVRVVGEKKMHIIGIPEEIERFDEVWQTVSQLAPLHQRAVEFYLLSNLIIAACGVGYLWMLWSPSPPIVLTLAAALACVMIWRIVVIRTSPNVSSKTRRGVWVYLFILFLVGLRAFTTLSELRKH